MIIVELTCLEAWREISEFIDHTLDLEMQRRMELHLKNCSHCKAVCDGVRNTVHLVADDRIYDLPSGFGDRMLQRLWVEFGTR